MTTATDTNGKPVKVGDRVRVLGIRESVLNRLDPKERSRVEGMKNAVFTVYEVDEWGGAWVQGTWPTGRGRTMSHSIMLEAADMERVE